jgi:prepilin-type N-terminal cleavage/methylation domain-containing protein
MNCSRPSRKGARRQGRRRVSTGGFSLVELVIVIAIALIAMAMAIPGIQRSLQLYSLRSAVSSLTGAIQGTRYQAIYHGCQYQLAFNASTYSYTIANQNPTATGTPCSAAFGTPSAAIPLMGRNVTLNANVTLVFHPSGQVVATVGSMTQPSPITLTYSGLTPEQITVSNYGRVSVTP